MKRNTITIEEFEAKYGYSWLNILRLRWLEPVGKYDTPSWRSVLWNDCPASDFFFDPAWMDFPEIYNETAPILAEIIKRSKEHKDIHCFAFGDDVYCVWKDGASTDEELEYKRFRLTGNDYGKR